MSIDPQPRNTSKSDLVSRPLDAVLGSEANVRLLRLLTTDIPGPLNAEEAARRTGLTPQGARNGFERLVRSGFVRRAGSGRSRQFVLNQDEPLVAVMRELFTAEQDRFDDLLGALRRSLAEITEVRSAWIAGMPMSATEPIEIALVAEPTDLPWIGAETRSRIAAVERTFDKVIEVSVYTDVDAPNPDPSTLVPLAGIVDRCAENGARKPARSHADHDQRSLATATAIARLVRDDPSLVSRAARYVDRAVREGRGSATGDLMEWRQVLDTYSPERLQQFLVSESQRAVRLRQSSPFLPVLTQDERERLARLEEGPQ